MSKIQVYIVTQVSCKDFGDFTGLMVNGENVGLFFFFVHLSTIVSFFEQLSIELYDYRGFVCGWHVLGKPPFPDLICPRPSEKIDETPKNTL